MEKIVQPLFDKKIIEEKLKLTSIPGDKIEALAKSVFSLSEDKITMGKKTGNEENVKMKVVVPILEFLGYDKALDLDFEESGYRGSIDIALRVSADRASIDGLVEVKYWKKDLDKYRPDEGSRYQTDVQQGLIYATEKGIKWFIITNGFEWRLYRTFIEGQIVYNFYEYFDLDFLTEPEILKKFYFLCSRESFENNRLQELFEKTELLKEELNEKIYEILITNRSVLFHNLLSKNRPLLNEKRLMEIGQKILDRLVFIRFAEDRNLFGKRILKDSLTQWQALNSKQKEREPLYLSIIDLFDFIWRGSTEDGIFGYNGGLFEPDELFGKMQLDNSAIETVIEGLYKYTDGKLIDFSQVPVDILGHIYEQYLGLSLTIKDQGDEASFTEDVTKSVRKKTGVYYTPKYIVNFIIENTVKKFLGSAIDKLPDIKILDPACGSGTFLSSAYDLLYLKYGEYNDIIDAESSATGAVGDLKKYAAVLQKYKAEFDKKILSQNLYGVDINPESVEITKMSLWFKTAQKNIKLNNLEDRIKCGDSLIDDLSLSKERAFVWQDVFAEVFKVKNPGFDIVIGNPPYFKIGNDNPLNQILDYQEICIAGVNAAAVFLNKSLKLLKNGGMLGFIVPKQLIFVKGWQKIREKLFNQTKVHYVIDCGKAFENVKLEQVIIIIEKDSDNLENIIKLGEVGEKEIVLKGEIPQNFCKEKGIVYLDYNPTLQSIHEKIIENSDLLSQFAEIKGGVALNNLEAAGIFRDNKNMGDLIVIKGWDVQRYYLRHFSYFDPKCKEIVKYSKRIDDPPRSRIVVQRIIAHIQDHIKITAAIDEISAITYNTVISIYPNDDKDIYFILGLLNSKLVSYYFYKFIYNNAIRGMDFVPGYANRTPIPRVTPSQKDEITCVVREIIETVNLLFKHDEMIRNIFKKYTGYKKDKLAKIFKENFYKCAVPIDSKYIVRTISAMIDDNLIRVYINSKEVLKLEIKAPDASRYLLYFLDSLDISLLNKKESQPLFDILCNLEIDDLGDDKSMQNVNAASEKIGTKIDLEHKIDALEEKLDQMIFNDFKLSSEEKRFITKSFI